MTIEAVQTITVKMINSIGCEVSNPFKHLKASRPALIVVFEFQIIILYKISIIYKIASEINLVQT